MAYFKDYEAGVSFKKKEDERVWNESYKKHKERLQKIQSGPNKSTLDNKLTYDFLHLQLRLKKLQFEEDRFAQIDYENRKLLDRIITIMKGPGGVDNWNSTYKKDRSLHGEQRKVEQDKIRRENREIHNRLTRARPMSLSAPAVPDLINKTRERIRAAEDKRIQEENRVLKSRISSVRSRIATTAPESAQRDTTQSRSSPEKPLQATDYDMHKQMIENASRRKPGSQPWHLQKKEQRSPPKYNYREKKIMEDNFFNESPRRPPQRTVSADEAQFIAENLKLERTVNKIIGSLEESKRDHLSDERQHSRNANARTLKKAIREENSIMEKRLNKPTTENVKRNRTQNRNDPYARENEKYHERLLQIKQGKRKVDVWRNTASWENKLQKKVINNRNGTSSNEETTAGPQMKKGRNERLPGIDRKNKQETNTTETSNTNNDKDVENVAVIHDKEAVEQDEKVDSDSFLSIHSWGEIKDETKDFNVPPGYRKKFRKKRKKQRDTSSENISGDKSP